MQSANFSRELHLADGSVSRKDCVTRNDFCHHSLNNIAPSRIFKLICLTLQQMVYYTLPELRLNA